MKVGKRGPKMRQLNERQQLFVLALVEQGARNHTAAAKMAGYGANSQDALRVQAYRLAHDEKILAALKEETEKRLQASIALAANVLVEIAEDPTHKDRLKAATALLNRGGLHETLEHKMTHDVSQDAKTLLSRFSVLAGTLGVDPVALLGRQGLALPPPEAVDVEFEVVEPAEAMVARDLIAEFEDIPADIVAEEVTLLDKFDDAENGERFAAPENAGDDPAWTE